MYEEISVKREIDWKSLFVKIGILVLVVFIICAVALSPKNSNATNQNKTIADSVLEDGKEYYTDSKLPNSLGVSNSISLAKLIENNIADKKEYESENCDLENSYVKVTKVGNNEYSIYAFVICNQKEEIAGDTITSSGKQNNGVAEEETSTPVENIEDNSSTTDTQFNENESINISVEE